MNNAISKKKSVFIVIFLFFAMSSSSSGSFLDVNNKIVNDFNHEDNIKTWNFIDFKWYNDLLIDNKWNSISDDDYNYDAGLSVQQTSDGGYIVGGYAESHDATSGEILYVYAVIYKFNTYGHIEWKKAFDGLGLAAGVTVQQTDDDGFILVGYTAHESGEDTQVLLLKTDQLGNIEWETTYQVMDVCMGYSVQQTDDGGYILSGTAVSLDTYLLNVLLVKTDTDGIMEWNDTYIDGDYAIGYSVQQTDDHGYIVCGYRLIFDFNIEMDAFLIKTNINGNEEWTKFLFTEMSQGTSCHQTIDSGYVITGTRFSEQENASLAFLVKLDNDGNEEWNRTYSVLGNASGSSVQQTSDNGYIITGSTYYNFEESVDVLLLKTDGVGNQEWNRTFEFLGLMASGASVDQTSDDGYIITGSVYEYQFPLPSTMDGILIKTTSNGSEEWIRIFKWTSNDSKTLYVGGSRPGNYSSIQDAIDNASDGDTVFVYNDSSPYYENVNVEKSIILIGEERNSTVIDGGGIDSVIEVSADHVHIEGFTVTNCRDDLSEAGINIFSDWNAIKNSNIVENQCMGIRLYGSNHNLIENNILKDNTYYNIYLGKKSNNNTVQNNTLTADNWPYACDGIWLDKSSNNLIENNEITGLKFTVGISLYERSSYNVVEKNIIYNNPCYGSGASIQIAGHSDFNLISNNEIRCNNGAGITMFFSQGNEIIGNTIDSLPYQGVTLCDCRYNNIIKFNNISSTDKGIQIGVYSSKNTIESNNLINNSYGIYLSGTDLLGFVPNNVISKNNIVENNYGIYITVSKYYGPSNDNLIYHNNFINNTNNAYDECNNIWDSGYWSGGNYWSDYTGDDFYHGPGQNELGRDWRGDTPYNVAGGDNQDMYPLILPYESERPFAIIEHPSDGLITSEHNVTIIGYITDNVGLVKSGTSHAWDHMATTSEGLHDELIPHLDFEFIKELKPGWNVIGIHATDPSNNKGHDGVLVYYYPDIVYVDDDYNSSTPGWQQYCFDSIQDGVDAVAEGGTVFVYNGTYYENVVVEKSINLIGENKGNTIIDGGGIGNVVSIHSENVNVNSFKIQNSGGISSDAGIMIYSDSTIISDNNVSNNNRFGIYFLHSDNNIISDNNIYFNYRDGIRLYNCNNNSITNNTIISNDEHGILFNYCGNNTISNNFISASSSDGIVLGQYSYHNEITKNIISDNHYGIEISNTSENNILYHNNILNNNFQGADNSINIWNDTYPSGGNYWDDYSGVDENDDGIGDTPYDLPCEYATDWYPLMNPWGQNPPVANFTYSVDNFTVTFDPFSSYDRDGHITAMGWSFGDDPYYVEGPPKIINHTYDQPGIYNVSLKVIDDDDLYDWITKQIEIEDGGYDFETMLLIGRITNLDTEGDVITFEAVNLRSITIFPFSFNTYISGEKIVISNDYFGFIGPRFIIGRFNAAVTEE